MNDNAIYVEWHISDVKDNHEGLTDDQCREVLQRVKYNHDANIGINWDVIDATVNQLFSRQLDLLSGLTSYKSSLINLEQESKDEN